jgi:hypothetical protein
MLCRRNAIALSLVLGLLFLSLEGAAQNDKKSANQPKQDQNTQAGNKQATVSPVTMRCFISDGGHQWNINATNSSGTSYNCQATCKLKTSTGNTTNGSCNPNVPANAKDLQVCNVSDNTLVWTTNDPVSFTCK